MKLSLEKELELVMMQFMKLKLLLCAVLINFCLEGQEGVNLLTHKELNEVNEVSEYYLSKSPLSPLAKIIYKAYIANAQKDFLWELQKEKGSFIGSFVPVTVGMWDIFQPDTTMTELENRPSDPKSDEIAERVISRYKERLLKESAQISYVKINTGNGLWHSYEPYGLNFPTLTPWNLKSCAQFRCPYPALNIQEVQKQVAAVKTELAKMDLKRLSTIDLWAHQAKWVNIADEYMAKQKTPLEVRVNVRAALQSAITDATGAAFDSKYAYLIPRPDMVDGNIISVIPSPAHPSYPSAQSTVSKASAVILSHFFPENKQKWMAMAEESGQSRVWAGIHFPIDHEAGRTLGELVGNATLKNLK